MTYRDNAKSRLQSLVSSTRSRPGSNSETIQALLTQWQSESLKELRNFANEYGWRERNTPLQFGFFFSPYPGLPVFDPEVKQTRRKNSPHFCLKLAIPILGNCYLIPLSPAAFETHLLVLKPVRPLRLAYEIQGQSIEGCSFKYLFNPYLGLKEALEDWAFSYQVYLRVT